MEYNKRYHSFIMIYASDDDDDDGLNDNRHDRAQLKCFNGKIMLLERCDEIVSAFSRFGYWHSGRLGGQQSIRKRS